MHGTISNVKRYIYPSSGDVFGDLTVVGVSVVKGRKKVFVKCKCGKELYISMGHLSGSDSKKPVRNCWACGRKKMGLSYRDYSDKGQRLAVFRNYQTRARQRGLSWSMTQDEFHKVADKPCVYCNSSKTSYMNPSKKNPWSAAYEYTGVDRIDSTKGYDAGNVQPCCKWCNMAKSDRGEKEFIDWVNRVAEVSKGGGLGWA